MRFSVPSSARRRARAAPAPELSAGLVNRVEIGAEIDAVTPRRRLIRARHPPRYDGPRAHVCGPDCGADNLQNGQ